jgi:hypothetical protein
MSHSPRLPDDYFQKPYSARVWNYWMGGKDNYPVDRAAGDGVITAFPEITTIARQCRRFLVRAVRHLAADAGVRQFLDIGTGLPTMQNTHEVAQSVAPQSRIVYVDNDPNVLAHATALLTNATPEGVTTYLDDDVHDPASILARAAETLDFDQPIAVMLLCVLGLVREPDEIYSIIERLLAPLPPGSYLALCDGVTTEPELDAAMAAYNEHSATPYFLRPPTHIERCFTGLTLVEPGVVPVSQWRPDPAEVGTPGPVAAQGGLAYKP